MKAWVDKRSIRSKMVLSFLAVVIVPLGAIGWLLTGELRQMALTSATEQITHNVDRVKKRLNDVLIIPQNISSQLLFDSRFSHLVNTDYSTTYDVTLAYSQYQTLEAYLQVYKQIGNIRFYMDNSSLLNNWRLFRATEEVQSAPWYKTALAKQGVPSWLSVRDETNQNRPALSLVQMLPFPNYQTAGVLVIPVNSSLINDILLQETFETMIIDENNVIVAANREHTIGSTPEELGIPTGEEDLVKAEVNGVASQVKIENVSDNNKPNGMKIVSVFSIENMTRDANRLSMLGVVVTLLAMIASGVVVYLLSGVLLKRLKRLHQEIGVVAEGHLEKTVQVDGEDEIGELSMQFNKMLSHVRVLLHEVNLSNEQRRALELKQHEMKLKLLASQINPHFLFNSLETIRMRAHVQGSRDIASVVKDLGKLLRRSLDMSGKAIFVEEELQLVRSYLHIQHFRYGNRLTFSIEMEPSSANCSMPPLVIQPLVENAVIHGIENSAAGGHISIKTKTIQQGLFVSVMDNGVGMSQKRLTDIQQMLSNDHDGDRIGLANVHSRLQMLYGGDAGLHIKSEPGQGTEVHFFLPLIKEEGRCEVS
ncbi:cache domain-containing sensor histidine kinase [Aureibacillus halotolerans]|uniref:histidine kinase n=1 Tax=Aureibacillus halotolerans TaxID=1508390 RepID=A0A4R6TRQ7_9BACI|nr:sensor histidine kinase [Aureibacillus halotolerans]TDQ36268.1 two-component system sensor histidine kinase YesM [Aureibacillus halotolerans]